MAKRRVYDIAKERGLTNQELLERLQAAGLDVKTSSSSVEEAEVDRALAAKAKVRAAKPSTAEEPATKPAPAAKRAATAPRSLRPPPPQASCRGQALGGDEASCRRQAGQAPTFGGKTARD